MWVLIVITTFMLNNGNTGGKNVVFHEFATRDLCTNAANQISGSHIKTVCVQN